MEIRDFLAIGAVLISLAGMLLVNRNARRATGVQVVNTDLTRIRDLRAEVRDLTSDVQVARTEAASLRGENVETRRQMVEIHEFSNRLLRERMEMIRYAQMPGVDIHDWLDRYGNDEHPRPIGGTINT